MPNNLLTTILQAAEMLEDLRYPKPIDGKTVVIPIDSVTDDLFDELLQVFSQETAEQLRDFAKLITDLSKEMDNLVSG